MPCLQVGERQSAPAATAVCVAVCGHTAAQLKKCLRSFFGLFLISFLEIFFFWKTKTARFAGRRSLRSHPRPQQPHSPFAAELPPGMPCIGHGILPTPTHRGHGPPLAAGDHHRCLPHPRGPAPAYVPCGVLPTQSFVHLHLHMHNTPQLNGR